MAETVNLGEIDGDECFFHESDKKIGFLIYIPLCENFVVLEADGTLIESGPITKNSCCLRCDRHEFDYEEKLDNWKSVRCIKTEEERSYELEEQISRMFTTFFMEPEAVELDICPNCYQDLLETGQYLADQKSAEITSSLI